MGRHILFYHPQAAAFNLKAAALCFNGRLPNASGNRRSFVDKFQVFDRLSVPNQNAAGLVPVPDNPYSAAILVKERS
ncbi:hypothetical protein [Microcoleus sp. B3-D7]|uniref:hypothetical protein n=1 Tax=Microcoleus sp. B3-D7 TaxID=2818659 RepID=UPI002FCEA65B